MSAFAVGSERVARRDRAGRPVPAGAALEAKWRRGARSCAPH